MQNQLSPKTYIITKARSLPFSDCYIIKDWKESGMATIYISKKMPSGNIIFALYLIDIYCLGVKNVGLKFNVSEDFKKSFLAKLFSGPNKFIKGSLSEMHNIIFGAVDYAADLGFSPHPDFALAQHLLDPELITDGIDEIEFGFEGKPYFVAGPDDNVKKIIETLNKSVGEGNYNYTYSPENDWDD